MTWLTPLFLAAGLAVAAPILFHMWQRTPRGRRLFSSTMFLAASPPRITQRSRIENWPLLLLRALALLLIAVGFSRPVWRTEEQAPTVSSPDKTVAILLDTSASLQRAGFRESLQKQVAARLEKLPAATHLGLFTFDHRWRPLVSLEATGESDNASRRQLVQEKLAATKPGWGSTRLGLGLAHTIQALREFSASRPVKEASEIWLVSDLASGTDLSGLVGIDWPESTRLEVISPEIPPGTNAGLQWIDAQTDGSPTPLRVRVTNARQSTRDRFVLGWESPVDSEPLEIHVPAGQSRTILAPARPANLSETVPLRLTGDDHEFDNRLWAATGRRREVWVLYLGTDAADDIAAPRFFLEQALAGTPDAHVTVKSVADVVDAAIELDPPVLAVWTDAAVEPPGWLRRVLNQGGSLLAVPQTADDARVMAAYQQISVEAIQEADVKDYSLLRDIDFEDPLFATFVQSRFADFSGIHFWKHRQISLPSGFAGRVLARFDDGDVFLVQQPLGQGRGWLLTSGWHSADSQLARSSKFAPLVQRMLDQSLPSSAGAARGPVGSEISWPLSRGSGALSIRLPDGSAAEQADAAALFVQTELPGIYLASRPGESASWAINLAPDESKTDPLPVETLERMGVLTKPAAADREVIVSPVQQRQLQLEELERRQAGWRWCLFAAGLVLLAETAWAGRKSKMTDVNPQLAGNGTEPTPQEPT